MHLKNRLIGRLLNIDIIIHNNMKKGGISWGWLILSIVGVQAVGVLGGLVTRVDGWYEQLVRPALSPPNWVFGVVWPILYLCLGVVLYRLWRAKVCSVDVGRARQLFVVQLVLNGLWTPVFFGQQEIVLALYMLIGIVVCVVYLMIVVCRFDRVSMWLLVPYELWLLFAMYLNWQFVALN